MARNPAPDGPGDGPKTSRLRGPQSKSSRLTPLKSGMVVRSLAWSTSATAFARLSQLIIGIIIAHILSRHDFGVFAVVLVVFVIIISISELGVSAALIRERGDIDEMGPTAVTLSIANAAILAIALWALSPLIANMLGVPEATVPLQIMSSVVLLAGPSAVPAALLVRDFQQGRRFAADMLYLVFSNVVLIVLAVMGFGVMSFVWSRVTGQVVSTITLMMVSSRHYWPGFNRKHAAHLLKFGLPLTGSNLLSNFVSSVDVLIIGRALGAVQLGVYNLASNVSNWPPSLFSGMFDTVGLPIFARVHHDSGLLKKHLENALRISCSLFFLVTALCVSLAQPLVNAIYGPKWVDAGPVLRWFAIYGSVQVLISLFVVILVACNSPRSVLWGQLTWFLALIPAMIIGVRVDGLVGGAIANIVVVGLIVLPLTLWQVHRASALRIRPIVLAMLPPFLAAVGAGIVAGLTALLWNDAWISLIAGGIAGTIAYLLILYRWILRLVSETKALYPRDAHETAAPSEADTAGESPADAAPSPEAIARHRAPLET